MPVGIDFELMMPPVWEYKPSMCNGSGEAPTCTVPLVMSTLPTTVPLPPKTPPLLVIIAGSSVPLFIRVEPTVWMNVPAFTVAPERIVTWPLFVKTPCVVNVFTAIITGPELDVFSVTIADPPDWLNAPPD